MHVHQLFATFSPIFTSVVVYSRTNQTKPKKTKKELLQMLFFVLVQRYTIIFTNLHSCATQKKKCGAHTHAHHSFTTFFSQYSRRLLSILAQLSNKNHNSKHSGLVIMIINRQRYHHCVSSIRPPLIFLRAFAKKC